jgi:hypothetical protein
MCKSHFERRSEETLMWAQAFWRGFVQGWREALLSERDKYFFVISGAVIGALAVILLALQ